MGIEEAWRHAYAFVSHFSSRFSLVLSVLGAYTYDVCKVFGFLDPLPLVTEFMQPQLFCLLFEDKPSVDVTSVWHCF